MDWQKVESTQVAEVGFEEPDTLGMKFKKKDGTVPDYFYIFASVPARMYRAMLAAKSVGIYFAENIKAFPEKYPFEKVQAENPTEPRPTTQADVTGTTLSSTSEKTDGQSKTTLTQSHPSETIDAVGEVLAKTDTLDSALALVDGLKADFVFVSGNMDPLIMKHRELALKEVAGMNVSTEKMRAAITKTKNKVVHSRTFIEKMRVGYVFAEKQRLKKVDEESTRIQDLYRGIEEEVLSVTGLTAWKTKDEARVQKHTDAIKQIEEMKPHVYLSIEALTTAIALLEEMDTETFEEFSVPAEKAKDQVLAELKADLAKRETAERDQAELEKLRAEANARAEADRVAAIEREAKEKAERALDAERERIQRESLAAEQRAKDAEAKAAADKVESERKATEAAAQAVRDQEAAVEAERKRIADEAERERKATEARSADAKHRAIFNNEIRAAILKLVMLDDAGCDGLIDAIANGLIPHITINY